MSAIPSHRFSSDQSPDLPLAKLRQYWGYDSLARIRSAVNDVGALERLGPINELLGEDNSNLQIRAVVDCLRVEHFHDHRPIQ